MHHTIRVFEMIVLLLLPHVSGYTMPWPHSFSHCSLSHLKQGRARRGRLPLYICLLLHIISPALRRTEQHSIPPGARNRRTSIQPPPIHATPRRLITTRKHGVVKDQGVCGAHMVWRLIVL